MEILILLIGFYFINAITNRLAIMSPLLSGIVYFIGIMVLFNLVNRTRLNRIFHSQTKQHRTQNEQFKKWQKESDSARYQTEFKVRDDIIEAEYTEKEISE